MEYHAQRLVDAVGGTGAAVTYELERVVGRNVHLLRVSTANYTGTLDIQGIFREDANWENVPYVKRLLASPTFGSPSVAQISYTADTTISFILTTEPRERLRLSVDPGGGNAGTITIDVLGAQDAALASSAVAGSTSSSIVATGIGTGRKTVANAGTRETLVAAAAACRSVIITAETDNTGIIVVGGSAVVATLATRQGTPLNAGESLSLSIDDLVKIYLDTTVNGDGVTYTYLT